MTLEERIAQLETELARERAEKAALLEVVQALAVRRRSSGAERQARYRASRAVTSDVTVTRHSDVTPLPPPLDGSPPPSIPSSPSPLSSPPSLFPLPSSAAPRGELQLESQEAPRQPKSRRPKPEKPPDPRHAPLTRELVEAGWPHHGGRTAKAVTDLLELAAQGGQYEDAGYHEVVRRAAIARAHDGFPRVRELHELVPHWGHFATVPRLAQGPPRPDPNAGIMRADGRECASCGEIGDGAEVGEPVVWLAYGCGCMTAWSKAGQHYTKAAEWAAQRRRGNADIGER